MVVLEGSVNESFKPQVDIQVSGPGGERSFRALMDSGCNVDLILPLLEVQRLQLPKAGRIRMRTASGEVLVSTYQAKLLWRGYERNAVVVALGDEAILGLPLLAGYKLTLEIWRGGRVLIEPQGEAEK